MPLAPIAGLQLLLDNHKVVAWASSEVTNICMSSNQISTLICLVMKHQVLAESSLRLKVEQFKKTENSREVVFLLTKSGKIFQKK